jgi:hypothetical protein
MRSRHPTRGVRRPPPKEVDAHQAIAAYLELAWPAHLPWTHFPAGEKRDSVERTRRDGSTYRFSPAGARLKRMGLHPGWFDFQFILPNAQFATAEVKRSVGGAFSDDQIEHRRRCIALGVAVATWETPEDAEVTITRWLAAFGLKPRATLGVVRAA